MWLLLACVVDPADSARIEPGEVPAPWSYTREDVGVSPLSAAELVQAIDAALLLALDVDPLDVFGAYAPQLTYATEGCPSFDPGWAPQVYWEGACTGSNGASWHGWALSHQAHGLRDEGGNYCEEQAFYYGFARVTSPEGTPFEAYGQVAYDDCLDSAGVRHIDASIEGDYYWGSAPDWLVRRIPVQLSWEVESGATGVTVALRGSVAAGVEPAATVELDMAFPEGTGTVTVWDKDGHRAEVRFAGGCGVAEAGEVCVDWSALTGWEARPWS